MIQHGTTATPLDKRDYSFHKTFGSVPMTFPDDFSLDRGLGFPNQNLPNQLGLTVAALPYGCTEWTDNLLCADEDGVLYNPDFTESIVHANASGGADMRSALKSVCNDGVQAKDGTIGNKRSGYYRVGQNPDYFDGFRTALMSNKRTISIGTPWLGLQGWATPTNGIIPEAASYDTTNVGWHCWQISGFRTINGQPYLMAKTLQGPEYGDGGWAYFSRETINNVMKIPGTAAFTVSKATPAQIQTVGITYLFLHNLYYGQNTLEVAELQKALISLGYSIVHATTTLFGDETKAALALFQAHYGIKDDGSHFGPLTRAKMNEILNPSQTLFGSIITFMRSLIGI